MLLNKDVRNLADDFKHRCEIQDTDQCLQRLLKENDPRDFSSLSRELYDWFLKILNDVYPFFRSVGFTEKSIDDFKEKHSIDKKYEDVLLYSIRKQEQSSVEAEMLYNEIVELYVDIQENFIRMKEHAKNNKNLHYSPCSKTWINNGAPWEEPLSGEWVKDEILKLKDTYTKAEVAGVLLY